MFSLTSDDPRPSRCCTACTGCRLSTESCTRWRWLHFNVQHTATRTYLSRHLQPRNCARNLRSSDTPLLCQPFTKTDFARRRSGKGKVRNEKVREGIGRAYMRVFSSGDIMFSTFSFVVCSTCEHEHDILKTNEPILTQIGTNDPRGKGIKRLTLGVRRSKFKVIQGQRQIWLPGEGIILDPLSRVGFIISN